MNIEKENKKNKFKKALEDVPRFSLKGNKIWAECISVYDGDTITVAFHISKNAFKFSVRLSGLDTPELRSKNPIAKRKAYKARDYLRNLILDEVIYMELHDFDKYGRLLADIYIDRGYPQSINQQMVEQGHGYYYDGGKKKKEIFKRHLLPQ